MYIVKGYDRFSQEWKYYNCFNDFADAQEFRDYLHRCRYL